MFWGKYTRAVAALGLVFCSIFAQALVISPTSQEVAYSYEAEFQTREPGDAAAAVEFHARYLFGLMKTPEIVRAWSLDRRFMGVGGPAWPPQFQILSVSESGGVRTIRYSASGEMILLNEVARTLKSVGVWRITLPFDLDQFFDKNCSEQTPAGESGFWYFHNPYRKGCEHLHMAPLARDVIVNIRELVNAQNQTAPADLPADLDSLRKSPDDDEFLILAINGFDNSPKQQQDNGRVNFNQMNRWFRERGFKEKMIQKYKDRPIHQFTKSVKRADGTWIHIRLLRLLAVTELDGKHVTFSKFLKKHIGQADVVVFEGHSGSGARMDLSDIEKRAQGRFELNPDKRQLFFFDACSSYAYFRDLFGDRKAPGKMNVLSNGIESLFGYELWMTKRFYRMLFDVNNNAYTWQDIMKSMEVPLRGNTFMLNAYIND